MIITLKLLIILTSIICFQYHYHYLSPIFLKIFVEFSSFHWFFVSFCGTPLTVTHDKGDFYFKSFSETIECKKNLSHVYMSEITPFITINYCPYDSALYSTVSGKVWLQTPPFCIITDRCSIALMVIFASVKSNTLHYWLDFIGVLLAPKIVTGCLYFVLHFTIYKRQSSKHWTKKLIWDIDRNELQRLYWVLIILCNKWLLSPLLYSWEQRFLGKLHHYSIWKYTI